MKIGFLHNMVILLCFSTSLCVGQSSNFTAASGDWTSAANWNNGVPISTTNATIESNNAVDVDGDATCNDLILESGSTLSVNSAINLTIEGDLDIEDPFVTIDNQGTITVEGDLLSGGNRKVTVAGTLEFNGSGVELEGGIQNPQ